MALEPAKGQRQEPDSNVMNGEPNLAPHSLLHCREDWSLLHGNLLQLSDFRIGYRRKALSIA